MRIRYNRNSIRGISRARLFSRSAELPYTASPIVSGEGKILAVHIRLISANKMTSSDSVSDIIRQFPNCHLTMMTPAIKRERRVSVGAMIQPGHIHSTCTDDAGNIMHEGDASFTFDNSKKHRVLCSVPDSRLAGYQQANIYVGRCRFSSTEEEISKWINVSMGDENYPLYIAVVPFTRREDRDKYLSIVKTNKRIHQYKSYSLLTHYNDTSTEVIRANSCVTFNSRMNEDYFNEIVCLGDNPSPQLAYIKLLNTLFPCHSEFIQLNIEDRILSDKEHYEERFHVFGAV